MKRSKRISISVSDEELAHWNQIKGNYTLSAFIREAVNEFAKIQKPERQMSLFDFFLKQNDELSQIKGELIDITAAMAKFEMIDIKDDQWEIKRKSKK
ncbi:hypothetical protein [Candidatus Lokiarchaeum ossiferum]|uniref:hypothetical protein n=1 Tax=Candidatus Lokiarchaeum ossiferum TaxID=2951803 RepID=UPI00352F2750